MISVTRAELADTEAIVALGRTTFTETFGDLFVNHAEDLSDYLELTFSSAKIASSLSKPGNAFWLARRDGLPIGYAKFKLHSKHPEVAGERTAQLQKIYVLQAYLGEGAGGPLLDAVVECARVQDCDQLWLTVLDSNHRAIRFYERNGWINRTKDTHSIGAQRFVYDVLTLSLS